MVDLSDFYSDVGLQPAHPEKGLIYNIDGHKASS